MYLYLHTVCVGVLDQCCWWIFNALNFLGTRVYASQGQDLPRSLQCKDVAKDKVVWQGEGCVEAGWCSTLYEGHFKF